MILSIISVQFIVYDLRKRKIIKSYFDPHLYIPFYIFSKYINATKKEKGRIGLWFWLTVCSVSITLISAIMYEFV
jgi:hypothetical protein